MSLDLGIQAMQTLLNWLVGSKVLPRNAQIKADYSYLNLCKLTPHVRGIFPKTFDYTHNHLKGIK